MNYVGDYRTKRHKGRYAIFWSSPLFEHNFCDVYSSWKTVLRELQMYSDIEQSVHDSSGRLVAYTQDRKVVLCHA